MSKFYFFRQNNSGGCFEIDDIRGIGCNVIIEADSAAHANERAERIGLYFDGASSETDCPCCGDRWGEVCDDDGCKQPEMFGKPITEMFADLFTTDVYVHHLNGSIERIIFPDKTKEAK